MANDSSIGPLLSQEEQRADRGKRIIERLRAGELPQMVDWFDPGLLAKVGVRSVISATLGSYTDQRLIQASTDNASLDRLSNRYNFSGDGVNTSGAMPALSEALPSDQNGAVWVDYIADLGDGFEATYAMAYLLAAEELKVQGEANPLPAGKLLIMGGDQVYPDATKQEYDNRLRDPYDWAFSTPEPKRKVFAIPGNHDWYDGLSAFSALFCSSRDRISRGIGTQLGGWSCQQHRSYFAIKLPHNWWIWGPDIQLADNLDDSQRDYFDLMADQTGEHDNIILCLAEPSWLHKNYDNMHEISMLARKNGAKICAIIAGDWHHYSRYHSDTLGIQFITAGGGGAFAHATHGLKPSIDLKWATPTGMAGPIASSADTVTFNRSEQSAIRAGGRDFTQNPQGLPPGGAVKSEPAAVAPIPKPSTDTESGPGGPGGTAHRAKPIRKADITSETYPCEARSIYPPQLTSRLLCLKNLLLPFRNRPFTYLVGIVYFVYAWAFVAADPRQSPITASLIANIAAEMRTAGNAVSEAKRQHNILDTQLKVRLAPPGPAPGTPAANIVEVLSQQVRDAEANIAKKQETFSEVKLRYEIAQGGTAANDQLKANLEAALNDQSLGAGARILKAASTAAAVSLGFILDHNALMQAAELSPMFAFMLLGLWLGLVFYVESESTVVKFFVGTLHAAAHIATLLIVSWLANITGIVPRSAMKLLGFGTPDDVTRVIWNIVVTLFVGGLLGGFVMGIYWTITSTLFKMHTGDAFGALGIKDYKNFLRIKLEKDRATIYPIALDRVPGRRGWRWQLDKGETRPSHNPLILPVSPLAPRLIEPPIAIDATKVMP